MFYRLASARPDVDWSISPVGLSAGGYNDDVFWDAETWMYPALLAQHPDEASTVVDYRFAHAGRGRAQRSTDGLFRAALRVGERAHRRRGHADLGGDRAPGATHHRGRRARAVAALPRDGRPPVVADARLAGDPGAADFWASRAEPGADGRLHITQVEGPDEQNWPVDDSVYVNATAVTTLRIAARAAALTGQPAAARWAQVAAGLTVLEPIALDGLPAVRPEFAGYAGQQVKQADTVLLTYPWEFPQPVEVDRSNLNYYTPRYDLDGPAMTDSVNSIIAAQLGDDCSAWTYTLRSLEPFVTAPFEQFTEARSGEGVFTFLTGEGGFLQDPVRLHRPALARGPPAAGPDAPAPALRRVARQRAALAGSGARPRTQPSATTVTLRSGAPATIDSPAGPRIVSASAPLVLPTRAAGPTPSNLARCRPATASWPTPAPPLTRRSTAASRRPGRRARTAKRARSR